MSERDVHLPVEAIEILESMGRVLEQLQPKVLECLGAIGVAGASPESLEWTNRLSDATETVHALTDDIFEAINATPTRIVEDPPVADELPHHQPDFETTELLRYALEHPKFRINDVRKEMASLQHLSAEQLRKLRRNVVSFLQEHGIQADWEARDNTRARRYTLMFHEGGELIDNLLVNLFAPQTVDDDLGYPDTPEPAEPVVEAASDVVAMVPREIVPAVEPLIPERKQLSISELLANGPLSLSRMIYGRHGVTHLEGEDFQSFLTEVKVAVANGNVVKLGKGLYALKAHQFATVNDEAMDAMIRGLRGASGIQPPEFRFRKRGRRRAPRN